MNSYSRVIKCQYCGSDKITEAVQEGLVAPADDRTRFPVPLFHLICLKCGSVVRSYVKDIAPFVENDPYKETRVCP